MEKKYLIIVIIVIAIIAVVAIVILKTLKEGTNPPGLLNAECTDSDNGKDYNTQGFITGIVPGGKEEPGDLEDLCVLGGTPTDECEGDKCQLAEFYCEIGFVRSEGYVCPNGCSNGACI